MKHKKQTKICAVCGDIAIAKNFGALSCKSCKPFFRRNAVKNKIFKCKSGGICQINITTRKRCRKCRLDKCFAVGMRKELILNDIEKDLRRSLIEEKRKMKNKLEDNSAENESLFDINSVLSESSDILSVNSSENINHLDEEKKEFEGNEITIDSDSGYYSEHTIDNSLSDSEISEIEDFIIINETIQNSVQLYKPTIDFVSKGLAINRPVNHFDIKYTEVEEFKLMEVIQAFKPIVNYLVKNYEIVKVRNVWEMPKFNNYFYEREIKNLINSIKNLNVFDEICENDRIALVKYGCVDIVALRATLCYDLKDESWLFPMNDDTNTAIVMKMDLLKAVKTELYITYRNYWNDLFKEYNSDAVILDLLTAMALFNPNRPNLIDREFVRVQQHFYLYLLQRYLTFKYRNKSESESKSMKLLNTLISARILGELEKKCFFDDYQQYYSPIVREILSN